MSDETTGWYKAVNGDYEKDINGHFFEISKDKEGWDLRLMYDYLATRPTLRECQILAHVTTRLLAGETGDV